jgi:hypothetical protein
MRYSQILKGKRGKIAFYLAEKLIIEVNFEIN